MLGGHYVSAEFGPHAKNALERRLAKGEYTLYPSHLTQAGLTIVHEEPCGRAREPNLSLATVYRTLDTLKEMGLVELCCLTCGDRQKYYQVAGHEEHYHFACLGCGRIVEVRAPRVEHVCRKVAGELGLTLTRANVCFEGYCPACAARREI